MRESLDQWDFVIAAYAVGILATLALVAWAWWDMKRAERRREEARRK
ncbi:heme exporter protein CcmD [Pelagerythrobacter rhizovicinus]|uniref:Heme exporter protein CcmD n=1 Tax=Pelagerythrobacter rhizovicinus TaxID=2268576 RepID=A0A4Q2KPC2_9SPHN|nr:heme exporter protein CcmD [Pelagerythrobacter rhizovicinus]RXZ66439.1 heme exporter protein CcmD [Pelagerythrobacter rhizovicinus]